MPPRRRFITNFRSLHTMRSFLPHRSPCRNPWALLLPVSVLSIAGWAVGTRWEPTPLKASAWNGIDTDQDGIPDSQEVVLGTDPLSADTDHDGYGDCEEFALQTDPTNFDDTPRHLALSIGMVARGEGSRIKIFTAILDPDGSMANNTIRFGALLDGNLVSLDFNVQRGSHTGNSAGVMGGPLFLMEFEVPRGIFKRYKEVTYFAVVGSPGASAYASADKVDLFRSNGVVVMRDILADPQLAIDPNATQTPGTTIHQPIPPDDNGGVPLGWEPGQVCYQETEVVGASGAVVTHEVISADCVDGWDTYCASDCSGTVGSSYQTIDTGVLLGG